MAALDVFEHIGPGGIECWIRCAIDPFAFEQTKEPIAGGIVATMPHRTHRAEQAVGGQVVLVITATKLAATVGMQDQRMLLLTLPNRHLHGPDHHLPVLPVMHGPAHNALIKQVQHDTQIQLGLLGLDLVDVGHPLGFRLQGAEITLQQIANALRRQCRLSTLTSPFRARPALQASCCHQLGNPVPTGRQPFLGQIFLHAAGAQCAPAVLMQRVDTAQQALIVALAGTGQALAPVVVATGRNPQAAAHQANRKLIAATLDHLIPQDDPLAKSAAASRKKSRSLVIRANSRLSRANSSSRGLPVPTKAAFPAIYDPAKGFISVQSVVADGKGRIWALDTAAPEFATPRAGGAKLVAIDLTRNRVVKTLVFPPEVILPSTYVNDMRFDFRVGKQGTVYVTDSSVSGPGGIIVMDIASGKAIRRLSGAAQTSVDPDFVPVVEGKPALLTRDADGKPKALGVASDGIALSADGKDLYFSLLYSRHLYAVSTALLRDPGISEAQL